MKLPLTLLATGATILGVTAAPQQPPNILLIFSDDHGFPDLGCYGNASTHTPNLDRFASEGARLNAMFTAAPQCVPSRAALLTGLSPVAARMARFSSPLPRDVVTLPELLRGEAGYHTGICRRYFHLDGHSPRRKSPFFEEAYERLKLRTFAERVDYLDNNSKREHTAGQVETFLNGVPDGKPWFLWVNFHDPHDPWDDNEYSARVDRDKIKLPACLPDLPGVRHDLARHYGEISRADEEFKIITDILKKRGLCDNTIIVFMGDNGNSVIRGKGTLFDDGLRVPLLVRWPGKIKPGTTSGALLSGEDLTPTLLDAAGVAVPAHMTGRSFLPLLTGLPCTPREYIHAERGPHGYAPVTETTRTNDFDLARCVRSERYKLIYNATPWIPYLPCMDLIEKDPGWNEILAAHAAGTLGEPFERLYFSKHRPIYELYDLESDPAELNNVAGNPEYAAVEKQLRHAMIEKMLITFDFLPLPAE
jgi:arylsulfatase A-like enzyme